LRGGSLAGDGEHRLGCIDGRHLGSAAREQQGGPARAGADIENVAALDAPHHVREHTRLGAGHQIADRSSEASVVECARGRAVRVDRIAVVIAVALHATSLTIAPDGGVGINASTACRVRSRYAS